MDYKRLMREALGQAEAARDDGDWAIGCIIALGNEIIARGRNTVNSTRNRLAHAEINALLELQLDHFDHDVNGDMLLVTTFEPCIMCYGAIVLSGIRKIVSGVNLDNSGASAMASHLPTYFQQPRYETTMITGVLERDCAEMWASGQAAQEMLANGYVLPKNIEDLSNDNLPVTYTTSVLPTTP